MTVEITAINNHLDKKYSVIFLKSKFIDTAEKHNPKNTHNKPTIGSLSIGKTSWLVVK